MNPFQNRRPGNISVEVPLLGFGDAHLGELFKKVDEAQSSATLKTPYSSGIHYYDTAPWYGHGLSASHNPGDDSVKVKRGEAKLWSFVNRCKK